MYGLLNFHEKDTQHGIIVSTIKKICGIAFFEVSVVHSEYRFLEKRRLKKAAKMMKKAGVRRALFPDAFSDMAPFEELHIVPVHESYLRAMTGAEIARCVMEQHHLNPTETCVGISAEHMGAEVRKALMTLVLGVRYTVLDLPSGGEEVCSVLRREYGVSVLKADREKQLKLPDIILTFGKAKPWGDTKSLWIPCGTFLEWEGYQNAVPQVQYSVSPEIEEQIPKDCCQNAVLSLLLEAGIVHENELEVSGIL